MATTDFHEEEFETQFNSQTLLRILAQTRPHWKWVAGFLISVAVVSFLDSYFTFLGKRIIDEGIVGRDPQALLEIILLYGALQLVLSAGVFSFIYLAGTLGERVQYDLRQRMFDHLQSLSLSYYDHTAVGWIMSRVTSDSERIAQLVTWGLLDITWGTLNIVTAFVFMMLINWRLALIILALIPVLLIVAAEFKKRILSEFRRARKLNSQITGAYNENITGVRVVKALGRERENLNEFTSLADQMYRASYRAAWLSALFLPAVQMISALAIGSVVWYGGFQVDLGVMTIGGIQAFLGYITFMMFPIQDLARVYAEMQHAIASAERVFSLIDAQLEVTDRPGARELAGLEAEIRFDNVDFYYEAGKPVLQDFNLTVRPGETIALVGPTGGGKSTIVNLLCRFYEPTQGTIRIDGVDYTEFTLHSLQSRVGMVLQTPHLFSGSVRENIRYGKLEASDEEVEAAAKLAGAHEFVSALDGGYEANVGEGGNNLSVGQKQLISLARAVLANPEILIMDEATSSVDTLTEALIQRGMEVLMSGRTSFVIAHRLSTIKKADRIVVIEDGAISETGTHAELLRAHGHYYRLYTQQFRRQYEAEHDAYAIAGD